MNNRTLLSAALLTSLGLSSAYADDLIYKYRSSDGSTTYSQERSGPGELEEVLRVPSTSKPASKRMAQQELRKDQAKAERLAAERREREQLENRITQAEQAVAMAEMALEANSEPLPEERLGTVNGGSRITPAYWMRLRAMQQSVDLAHERLRMLEEEIAQ